MSLSKTFVKSKNAYKVSFKLEANIYEGKDEIRLLGTFNNWDWSQAPALKKLKTGYKVDVVLEPGQKYEYRYCIDNKTWFNDPAADSYIPSPHYAIDNCIVELPATEVVEKIKPSTKKKAPTKSTKVDLTLIEGIGPKIASILTASGKDTFEKIAKTQPAAIKKILLAAGKRYTMHDPTTWPIQAQLLADGKIEKLNKLQAELKGGKSKK